MNRSLLSRAAFTAVIAIIFAGMAFPPEEKIRLGLDLQGGMHLVLQVQTEDALKAETGNAADRVVRELESLGIAANAQFERSGDTTFNVRPVPAGRDDEVKDEIIDRFLGQEWEMSRQGETLTFDLSSQGTREIEELAVGQALETIRNRVDAFGVAEPVIHREGLAGSKRVVVQLPGVDDPERIKQLIKNTAFLEFRLVADGGSPSDSREGVLSQFGGTLPPGVEVLEEDQRAPDGLVVSTSYWPVETNQVLTGRDLKTARPSTGQINEPVVNFILTHDGGKRFGEVTAANIGRGLAIILDGKVVSAPTIRARITDSGIIEGSFTLQEVQDLSTVLRAGALPAGLTYLEERTVGPTLGRDSILKGRKAGMIGGLLVILTMLVVYRLTGVNAVTALLLNVVLVFGALASFGATLTVPGIAGIVLTIGMAVDANVLIFERVREELRAGRTVKSAIAAGFSKAFSSIFDANVTTLIAAMCLFLFGTGPIRGFAVTLSIGILASVFTAVFVSRLLFDTVLARRQRVETLSI